MLNDFPSIQQLEAHRDDEINGLTVQMNPSLQILSEVDLSTQQDTNSSNTINITTNSNNSTCSSSNSEQRNEHFQTNNLNHQEQQQQQFDRNSLNHNNHNNNNNNNINHQQQQREQRLPHYFNNNNNNTTRTAITTNTTSTTTTATTTTEQNHNYNKQFKFLVNSSTSSPITSSLDLKSDDQTSQGIGNMNIGATQHNNMIPTAHGSEHQIHYSLPTAKNLPNSSPSNMALNFSHDLLQQASHHNQTGMQQHSDSIDIKPQITNSFELDSGTLMQSAVGMNMWRNSMGLNHFKHPAISDHNFLPSSDLNSFSSWPHGNNLGHQSSNMTHHILDTQHLIGYQHQRSLPIGNQEPVGSSSIKSQSTAEQQASFMLNSINHQASTSQNSSSNDQASQPLDNLNLRSHQLDHNASYNRSMNDNQFYNSSRSESRSHPNAIKNSLSGSERSVHMSLVNNQNQLSYHNNEQANLQPTTSHHVAGSSATSGSSTSKSVGSFKCSTCNEVFSLRTVYQSHLKTHSQEKGFKAKFQCELCGHSFSQKTSLNRHMKSHTGERPFPCEICAKAFSEKERLKIHMRTHTGEKPFSCGVCGKSFSQKSTVKRHQTVHTGEKKFRCDCGKGFANRGNLIAHIKTRGSNHFE